MTIYLVTPRPSWRARHLAAKKTGRAAQPRRAVAGRGLLRPVARRALRSRAQQPYRAVSETVVPIAGARRLPIEPEDALAEGAISILLAIVRKHKASRRGPLQSRRRSSRRCLRSRGERCRHQATDRAVPRGAPGVLEAPGGSTSTACATSAHRKRRVSRDRTDPRASRRSRSASAGSAVHADEEDVDLLAHALQCGQLSARSAPETPSCRVGGSCTTSAPPSCPDAPD